MNNKRKKKEEGLFYRNGAKENLPMGRGEIIIQVSIKDGEYTIREFSDGMAQGSYAPCAMEKAAVYMNALMLGYQPPRALFHRDIQAPQTVSG